MGALFFFGFVRADNRNRNLQIQLINYVAHLTNLHRSSTRQRLHQIKGAIVEINRLQHTCSISMEIHNLAG
jgi:hypothetical protein